MSEYERLDSKWIDENKVARINNLRKMTTDDVVPVGKLQNLLVPKQERITLKQVINRLYELEQNNQSLWINRILHEFGRVFGINKYQEGYEQGRADGIAELHSDEAVTINYTPTIPQFVANVIEKNKRDGFKLIDTWEILNQRGFVEDIQTLEWVRETTDNNELFARAWLDGYTVEEEQKYYVLFGNQPYDDNWTYALTNLGSIEIFEKDVLPEWHRTKLTEQEIKDCDERFWAFAVKVEELEE